MAEHIHPINCSDCICKADLFSDLPPDDFDIICRTKQDVEFNAGEIIFKQGAVLTHVVCLTQGLAKIYFEGIEKKNLILRLVKPSELVGGPGMFVDRRHHYSLGAVADCKVCFIDVAAYREVVFKNKKLAHEVMNRESQHRIELYTKLVNLTQKQMPGRIAEVLMYLYGEVYNSTKFNCALSRQEIADLSAMSKESAIRILKDFKDEGYITLDGNDFEIFNVEALAQISNLG
ncbi:MAG: Crp/Fnr family transcriptional regulator [Bacteroidales bacterium]|nr:Crp/Fnr family transcriptional regulator [Bacteroidales bacterium]